MNKYIICLTILPKIIMSIINATRFTTKHLLNKQKQIEHVYKLWIIKARCVNSVQPATILYTYCYTSLDVTRFKICHLIHNIFCLESNLQTILKLPRLYRTYTSQFTIEQTLAIHQMIIDKRSLAQSLTSFANLWKKRYGWLLSREIGLKTTHTNEIIFKWQV